MNVVTDSNGHSIVVGRSPDRTQGWAGVKPSDLLLMAVASCSGYDVVEILTKQHEPFEDMKIYCHGDQLPDPPYTFTHIHLEYVIKGAVNPKKLEKAIQLSEGKYCSVIASLKPTVTISHEYRIEQQTLDNFLRP